jgi:hypothetical protein
MEGAYGQVKITVSAEKVTVKVIGRVEIGTAIQLVIVTLMMIAMM